MAAQASPPRRKAAMARATTVQVPVFGFRQYAAGMGPPQEPLYLVPPRDSTAYIIEKVIWPPLKDTTSETRRLPYYRIGFTDLPGVKTMISCDKALEYVSPREIEDWEYNDLERRIQEKERLEEAKKASKAGASGQPKPGKRRPGRPFKKRPADIPTTDEQPVSIADATLLAEHVAGPSLSTPQKRKRAEQDVISTTGSESAAIRRQLGAESSSDGMGTGREDETGPEDPFIQDYDMGNTRSTSMSLPALRPVGTTGPVGPPVVEDSSRASSAAPAGRPGPLRRSPRPPKTPIPADKNSTRRASLSRLRPSPRAASSKPSPTPKPANPAPFISAPVAAGTASPGDVHPAWAKTLLTNDGAPTPLSFTTTAGQQSGSFTPIPKPSSFTPQNQPRVQGFKPIFSNNRLPSTTHTRVPTTPVEASDSTSSKARSASGKKSKGKRKTTPTKSSGRKSAKKAKLKAAESDEENVWKVKALLDDKYDHTRAGQKVHLYLVDWDGDWAPTWEPKENIQDDNLIAEYQRRKRAGLLRPDKSQRSMISFLSKSPYANVREAFDGDIINPDNAVGSGTEGSGDELLVVDQSATKGKAPASSGKM